MSAAGKGKRKAVYRNSRISPGRSTHLRDAATPNGTDVGTQRLGPTPKGKNVAWQFIRRKGASEEELKTQREKDSQSVKDSRKRAKKEQARGYPVRQPLNQRALAAGTSSSRGLFTGPKYEEGVDRLLTQNAFSKMVCRAEQSTAEKEKSNKERRAHDNYQLALDEIKRDGGGVIVVNYFKAAARDGHVEAMWRLG